MAPAAPRRRAVAAAAASAFSLSSGRQGGLLRSASFHEPGPRWRRGWGAGASADWVGRCRHVGGRRRRAVLFSSVRWPAPPRGPAPPTPRRRRPDSCGCARCGSGRGSAGPAYLPAPWRRPASVGAPGASSASGGRSARSPHRLGSPEGPARNAVTCAPDGLVDSRVGGEGGLGIGRAASTSRLQNNNRAEDATPKRRTAGLDDARRRGIRSAADAVAFTLEALRLQVWRGQTPTTLFLVASSLQCRPCRCVGQHLVRYSTSSIRRCGRRQHVLNRQSQDAPEERGP